MQGSRMRFAVLGVACVVGACGPSQQDAQTAIKAAEEAITAQHADAIRYAPEAFAALMAGYDTAKRAFEAKDYRKAIAAAQDVATAAKYDLSKTINTVRTQMGERLTALKDSVQQALVEIERRAGTRRGVKADVDSLEAGMTKALAAEQRGDLADALHAVLRVQEQAAALKRELGIR